MSKLAISTSPTTNTDVIEPATIPVRPCNRILDLLNGHLEFPHLPLTLTPGASLSVYGNRQRSSPGMDFLAITTISASGPSPVK